MDLTPNETAIVELLRAMGSEPLHVSFTSTGEGVVLSIVTPGVAPVAGWGVTVEEAFANAYGVPFPKTTPEPQAKPAPRAPLRVVAGTDGERSPRA